MALLNELPKPSATFVRIFSMPVGEPFFRISALRSYVLFDELVDIHRSVRRNLNGVAGGGLMVIVKVFESLVSTAPWPSAVPPVSTTCTVTVTVTGADSAVAVGV